MNVREYFEKAFPGHEYTEDRDPAIDSPCGEDCVKAINRAKELDNLIREGHGPFYHNHAEETRAIANIALNLCGLYICG